MSNPSNDTDEHISLTPLLFILSFFGLVESSVPASSAARLKYPEIQQACDVTRELKSSIIRSRREIAEALKLFF